MDDRRFFCLRGFMKSGTNWLGSLLSSHEHINVVGEFHWQEIFGKLDGQFNSLPVYAKLEYREFVAKQLENFFKACLVKKAGDHCRLIGERTPHTIEPIVFPGTPVISIIRDGRDVLVSRAFHIHNYPGVHRLFKRIPSMRQDHEEFKKDSWFFQKNPEVLLRHELFVRESVRWWRAHLEQDRMTVERLPDLKVRFVQYEELHRNTRMVRKELFEFLGVKPKKASKIEGNLKPGFDSEQPTDFYRKGAVGDWKNYFTDEVKDWFMEEAGEELLRQGYVDSTNW